MKTKKSVKASLENRRIKFFAIGLIVACAATLASFEWRTPIDIRGNRGATLEVDIEIEDDMPIVKIEKPKPKVKPTTTKKAPPTEIKVVDKIEEEVPTKEKEIDDSWMDKDDIYGEDEPEEYTEAPLPKIWNSFNVEKQAMFACAANEDESNYEMQKFLAQNIKYPRIAVENKIQGMVMISFVVNKKGEIKDVKAENQIGGNCAKEAERVVKMFPKWCPAKQFQQPVSVKYTIPVRFTLKG